MLSVSGNPSLNSCWFSGNSTCLLGGGFYSRHGEAVLVHCTFIANRATELALGGGMANEFGTATLRGCVFIGNDAVTGGGMYNHDGNSFLTNCAFAENSASNGSAVACDYDAEPSNLNLANCILWDGEHETWQGSGSLITITFSDVYGGWPGDGCVNLDPNFTRDPDPGLDGTWGTDDDDPGDVHLLPESPCIDAGDNTAVPPDAPTDPDGNPRIADGDGDGTPTVDMGVYEFQRGAIPTLSEWGLIALAVLIVAGGTLVLIRRRPVRA